MKTAQEEKCATYWQSLRNEVERANQMLSVEVFTLARKIFLDYYASVGESPRSLTVEYDQDEFLMVMDEVGQPFEPGAEMLEILSQTIANHPEFVRWFKEGILREGRRAGAPVILVARWLCHLVGLRHGTVEIFLDPPDRPGYTLVQVRGMSKFHAPGAFDIPCAGHISGTDTIDESLRKELAEELNLTLDDLCDFRLLSHYNSFKHEETRERSLTINNEYRVLYRATLKPEAVNRIQFTDGEVAGLTVFAVSEMRELVRRFPERVASGLGDAVRHYQ